MISTVLSSVLYDAAVCHFFSLSIARYDFTAFALPFPLTLNILLNTGRAISVPSKDTQCPSRAYTRQPDDQRDHRRAFRPRQLGHQLNDRVLPWHIPRIFARQNCQGAKNLCFAGKDDSWCKCDAICCTNTVPSTGWCCTTTKVCDIPGTGCMDAV